MLLWSLYEIIHICTAVDESEEWSSQWIFQFKQLERRSLKKIRESLLRWSLFSHFHQPQYKYELFHVNFTSSHCTGRYELNILTSLLMCGFIAQLVEHHTGIAEVTGSNLVEALIFFRLLLSNCLNWKIYCDDHSSLPMLLLRFACSLP